MRSLHLVLLPALLGLSACALSEQWQRAQAHYDDRAAQVEAEHARFVPGREAASARLAAQDVARPWVAGRAQPLAREVQLPLALRTSVHTTLLFADGTDELGRIAQRITAVTGIPVHVRPDALIPAEHFLPRLAGVPVQPPAGRRPPEPFELAREPAHLAQTLDRLAARLGVRWRYAQERIEFYRTETRTFDVRALTLEARTEASLGLGRETTDAGFVSSSHTRLEGGDQALLKTVQARLEPFLSRAGVLVAEPGAGASIVVTDTPEVLERIGRFLERENRALNRRVRIVFEELTVALDEHAQASLDWNLIFSAASVAARLASPASPSDAQGGALALGLSRGALSGSEAIVRALGESVRLVRRSSVPMLTLNRRPVTHAVRTTFSYIDRVETTPLSGTNGLAVPAVSVSQKEETVGSLLTLVPDARDDGRILLSLAYDNTVAQPLKTVTFGDRTNPLQLQQLTVEGNGTVQQLALQPGQPLVVSGFDRRQSQSARRRLGPGVPAILGGSDALDHERLTTVLVVTAQIEEDL